MSNHLQVLIINNINENNYKSVSDKRRNQNQIFSFQNSSNYLMYEIKSESKNAIDSMSSDDDTDRESI